MYEALQERNETRSSSGPDYNSPWEADVDGDFDRFQVTAKTKMRLYAILAACLVVGVPAATSDGTMQTIATEADCTAARGTCIHRDDCDTGTHVFQEGCGGTYDGCCIAKEIVCASKNGTFITDTECEAKSGFRATGLHLGDKGCCAPFANRNGSGGGHGQGSGQGQGQGKGQGSGQGQQSGSGQGQGQGKGQESGSEQGQGQISANGTGVAQLFYGLHIVFVLVCTYRILF
ncbi:hypothetical protein LSAT2_001030 [Lamellibrachia satsuma]|nr:hypothetical protein LSAT2_001030 [Lamellibrachia satsuma]